MVAVQEIKMVGPSEAEKLSKAGVTTVEGLVEQGKTRSGRHRLATASGLPEHDILKWVDRAHLMELKGVGKQYADLLEVEGGRALVFGELHRAEHALRPRVVDEHAADERLGDIAETRAATHARQGTSVLDGRGCRLGLLDPALDLVHMRCPLHELLLGVDIQ